jgi:hypothetical protein
MSPNYIDTKIECPFYIKDIKKEILCEGSIVDTVSIQKFRSASKRIEYEQDYCSVNGGRKCPHYRAVDLRYCLNRDNVQLRGNEEL